MLGAQDNIGIKPDELKIDIKNLTSIKSELDAITRQMYASFSDAKASKRGADVDYLTDTQENMVENFGIQNENARRIIDTLNILVASYQNENDEQILNVKSAKPNQ